jgi:predicted HicB family RNase H-like nuclease
VPPVPLVKVNLDNRMHRKAKAAAALDGKTLGEWLAQLVEAAVVDIPEPKGQGKQR